MTGCPTGKISYPDEVAAGAAADRQRFRADPYGCGECGGWHLANHTRKPRHRRRVDALTAFAREQAHKPGGV